MKLMKTLMDISKPTPVESTNRSDVGVNVWEIYSDSVRHFLHNEAIKIRIILRLHRLILAHMFFPDETITELIPVYSRSKRYGVGGSRIFRRQKWWSNRYYYRTSNCPFGWLYPNINSPWSGITSVTIFSSGIVRRQVCDKLTSAHLRILC